MGASREFRLQATSMQTLGDKLKHSGISLFVQSGVCCMIHKGEMDHRMSHIFLGVTKCLARYDTDIGSSELCFLLYSGSIRKFSSQWKIFHGVHVVKVAGWGVSLAARSDPTRCCRCQLSACLTLPPPAYPPTSKPPSSWHLGLSAGRCWLPHKVRGSEWAEIWMRFLVNFSSLWKL